MHCGFLKKRFQIRHCNLIARYFSLTRTTCNVENLTLSHSIYEPSNKDSASGNPFLITHGLLGSKGNWNAIAKAVAKATNRKVITFDARNHGDSHHVDEHSYDHMADDILQLVESLSLSKFALMGHSMGGRTVMAFALRYPEFLEKLVVVDVSPISMSSDFPQMKMYLQGLMDVNLDLTRNIPLSEARKIADSALTPIVPDPAVRAFLLTNLAEADNKIYWKPNLDILIKTIHEVGSFPPELLSKSHNSPTLFIRGEKSPYIMDDDIPGMRKIFSDCKIDTINNAGHWPHAENIKDFLGSLIPFLNS